MAAKPRMVLLDVFGTLLIPRKPVWTQYADISRTHGLSLVDADVKGGMKQAFKELNRELPLYGKASRITPEDWWTSLIERTLRYADVAESDLQTTLPTLAPAILRRFESSSGYGLSPDVLPFLSQLSDLPQPPRLGLCSNSDRRIVGALRDLNVFDYIPEKHLITSWDVESSKPEARIFQHAVEAVGEGQIRPSETLFIGDDYEEDCVGAQNAGLQAALLARDEKAHPNVSDAPVDSQIPAFSSLVDVLSLWK